MNKNMMKTWKMEPRKARWVEIPKTQKNSSILEIFCFAFIFNYLSFFVSESLFRHASRILGLCKVFVTFVSLFGRTCSKTQEIHGKRQRNWWEIKNAKNPQVFATPSWWNFPCILLYLPSKLSWKISNFREGLAKPSNGNTSAQCLSWVMSHLMGSVTMRPWYWNCWLWVTISLDKRPTMVRQWSGDHNTHTLRTATVGRPFQTRVRSKGYLFKWLD